MKRTYLLWTLLFAVLLLAFIPQNASATELYSGTWGALSWEYADGELFISGNGTFDDFFSVLDRPWTHLAESVHTITIENGITGIGDHAFFKFRNLTTVRLPDSIERIGVAAFSGCENLTWILDKELNQTLPSRVRSIDIAAFAYCTSLTTLSLGQSVQYIGPSAFSDCTGLMQITTAPALTHVDNFAFFNCCNLNDILFFESLNKIGQEAFYGCTNLTTIRFTGAVAEIHATAFSGVSALVTYPEGKWTLYDLGNYGGELTWQEIPSKYFTGGSCGYDAFWGLDRAGQLTIYGSGAMFDYNTVYYPPWYALKDNITSAIIDDGITTVGDTAFYKCFYLAQVQIPDSVVCLGRDAFLDCDSLIGFEIGPNVCTIEFGTFLSCGSMEYIRVSRDNPNYASDDQGCLYSKDMRLLIQVPCGLSGHLEIPQGVREIATFAAGDCIHITSVTIPNSVSIIGNSAFLFCKSLGRVEIPASVQRIDHSAFWCCMTLSEIRFMGDAPEFVGDSIFVRVNATATYPAGNTTWTSDKFLHPDSSITWIAEEMPAFCIPGVENAEFYTLDAALAAYDPQTQYIRLMRNAAANTVLDKDLRIDLAGHALSGQLVTNGHTIYGLDSKTDGYTCENMGYFSCKDENGDTVVPKQHLRFRIGGADKRYLAIETPKGYTFHRFYLGITHMSLKPAQTAFGYKASFYGDTMVQSKITSLGYRVWVTQDKKVTCTKTQFQNQLTLQVRNFDVVNHGQTPLYASVFITLEDGIVIETARTGATMQTMLETINSTYEKYSKPQLDAIAAMIERNPIIKTWNTKNLFEAC